MSMEVILLRFLRLILFLPLVDRNFCLQLPPSPSPGPLLIPDDRGVQNNGPQHSTAPAVITAETSQSSGE